MDASTISRETVHARLVAKREDPGDYVKMVFQDLDNGGYVMVTKFPNWQSPVPQFGKDGYLEHMPVLAGRSQWYDREQGQLMPYSYDFDQFIDFVETKRDQPLTMF